jgi:hypothetical protein
MADEYRITLPKTEMGGFSESPDQTIGNSGSPLLDNNLTIKNGIGIAVAYSYGKRVFNAGYTATIDQIGNSRLDEAIAIGTKIGGYIALGIATGGAVVALAATAEVATLGITTAVTNHAINLENRRIRATRGTLINFNAGGYYG